MDATAAVFTAPLVARQTGIATDETTVTVTMLDDRFVCMDVHAAKSKTIARGAIDVARGAIALPKASVSPMSALLSAEPSASVPAAMISAPQGTPFAIASEKFR